MELNRLLRQFKKIAPREEFTNRSKADLLSRLPVRRTRVGLAAVLADVFQARTAVALAGILLLIVGTVKFSNFVETPFNTEALRAEAEAIDMQIQLADVSYNEFGIDGNTTLAPKAKSDSGKKSGAAAAKKEDEAAAGSEKAPAAPDMNVDEALDALSSM